MPIAILNSGPDSNYDDHLPLKYHFKKKHRSQIIKRIGQEVIIYGPAHTGGPKAYTAIATLTGYVADNDKGPNNFYATFSNYRKFKRAVPHMVDGRYVESSAVSKNGHFAPMRSVRLPSNDDFDEILRLGNGQ